MIRKIRKNIKLTIVLVFCLFLCACWPKTENYFLDSGKLQVNGVIYVPYSNINNECEWTLAGPYEEIGRFDRTNWAAYKYKYAEQADAIEAWNLRRTTSMAYLYIGEGLEVPEPTFEHIGKVEIYSSETDESIFLRRRMIRSLYLN